MTGKVGQRAFSPQLHFAVIYRVGHAQNFCGAMLRVIVDACGFEVAGATCFKVNPDHGGFDLGFKYVLKKDRKFNTSPSSTAVLTAPK
jgi:hypothetical protein